ncbi:MAG TPA: hypothetical protein VGK02_00755 [Candidatus Aquicultor sp.]
MRVTGSEARLVPKTASNDRARQMQQIEDMLDEQLARAEAFIRENPVPAILGALAAGLLLGILFGRR